MAHIVKDIKQSRDGRHQEENIHIVCAFKITTYASTSEQQATM